MCHYDRSAIIEIINLNLFHCFYFLSIDTTYYLIYLIITTLFHLEKF